MRLVDELLEDEQLLDAVYEAQGQCYAQSRRRGRMQTQAELVLRLLLLKHIRSWSYDTLGEAARSPCDPCSGPAPPCVLQAYRLVPNQGGWMSQMRKRLTASPEV